MAAVTARICETSTCSAPAKLQCPTCIKLGIVEGSFFCSQVNAVNFVIWTHVWHTWLISYSTLICFASCQECFKSSWSEHKVTHKQAKSAISSVDQQTLTNPWPGYKFSGELRPYYPLSSKRVIPDKIPKPDYGERDDGRPVSELAVRGTSSIKVLSDEEIEGMRIACKVKYQTKQNAI